ncbi:hypothetical protein KAFR_0C04490 [Kazachstania africana CBS 2517]|uniref:WHIM1 domain-containing protein n=1 Tax=Kazachstania africana (strain ATCC 22294 / BCRC 22015 / CBS 2517 / CECT 1963 / NBRC 1671 / NRRL Y-8276) TaxID=1071382 RepID=H2ASU0_KAZAF|nr:hypothetical protein KAFR_0C04490 [Kazachstania africana CBS 2517]CCF57440.1 hypothetical protein KAFR_0C04490 [Kazachstania africana CBS 2517]
MNANSDSELNDNSHALDLASASSPKDGALQNIDSVTEQEVMTQKESTVSGPKSAADDTADEAAAMGLRRSRRVPKPRTDLDKDFFEAPVKRKYTKSKNKSKVKGKKKGKDNQGAATKDNLPGKDKITKKAPIQKNISSTPTPSIESQEPSLTEANWASNAPLLSSDFKTHQSVLSRLKSPNMKALPYGGDVMKVMTFINKFSFFLYPEILSLSFQDFEIGLDLYPSDIKDISADWSDIQFRKVLYQDYIPVKDIIKSQDKMNLLFISFLHLLFKDSRKAFEPISAEDFSPSLIKTYKPLVEKLRTNAPEWGYPLEWKTTYSGDPTKPELAYFDTDDTGFPVDPKNPEILTPNVYTWAQKAPLPFDSDPLFTPGLEDEGILALSPGDRIVLFRALIDWCTSQSLMIHNEIYHLSHPKRDPPFGIQTHHVARYFLEGPEVTFNYFKKLCTLVQARYEIRSKKKHFKKQLQEGKKEDFSKKLKLLNEIKETLNITPKEEKGDLVISLYDKWCKLFEGELMDNPLSDPYQDPIYKLRSQEFFVGRIPHMGDFYIPRLHTYSGSSTMTTFTDLRSLKDLLEKFKTKEYNVHTYFENNGQNLSSQFKLLYHDTPSLLRDIAKGSSTTRKVYWYEMCHDTKTLKDFIKLLDYKIVRPVDKDIQKDEIAINTPEPKNSNTSQLINTHPLPKDARYNTARNKLSVLKNFLDELYYILLSYEELREQYADMKPGRRQLRRLKRQANYDVSYDSDEDYNEISTDEFEYQRNKRTRSN